jgi:CheY-like chemotaxis protein
MILIVEDDPDLAETCSMLLLSHGFTVATAGNGVDALKKIARCMPEMILSDCQMPRMGGIELCARIRDLYPETAIPVILMSGTDEYRYLSSANYNTFLKKPFTVDQLIRATRALLNPVNTHPIARSRAGKIPVH